MSAASGLDALFRPGTVAVVGASDRPGAVGTTVLRNLSGFDGEVVAITTSEREIAGYPTYTSLRDVPERVDLAVVVVPAAVVPDVMADAAAAGVRCAVVLAGGFAEAGEDGETLQRAIVDAARAGGVRVVGPNCFGVVNTHSGLNASIAAGTPELCGDIALATQSGAYGMAIFALGREQHLGFSKVYSAGNKADVADAELLELLGADAESQVLCFFLESIIGGREFFTRARAITAEKPIILVKTGRTGEGARAAVSHTAALAGEGQAWRGACDQAGVTVAANGLEMIDAAKALDWQPAPDGPRVGIVTNSGGTGVELTDLLAEEGMVVPELSDDLRQRLSEALPEYASAANPVDVTPDWPRFAQHYEWSISALTASGEVDAVVVILLHRSAADPEVTTAVSAAAREATVPVYVCWVAPEDARPNLEQLQSDGVPCFAWPQRTARAVAHAWRHGRARRSALAPAAWPERPEGLDDLTAGLEPGAVLDVTRAARLMEAYDIAQPSQAVCEDAAAAVEAADPFDGPVVVKLTGGGVTHKSDVGGVRTGLIGAQAVHEAADALLELDGDARLLVQQQVEGVEVIVGASRDLELGPLVLVGLGGVFVELLGDTVVRLAPLSEAEARQALLQLRGEPLLTGARGRSSVDLDALARTVAGTSQLIATLPEIAEVDLNPVMASPDGAVAVDVRVVLADPLQRG